MRVTFSRVDSVIDEVTKYNNQNRKGRGDRSEIEIN
jgi:hypothetical protein